MDKKLYDQIEQIENDHWWYVARRQIMFDWIFRELERREQPRILDAGCGTGYNIEYLKKHGYHQVMGLDYSLDALRYCQSRQLTGVFCADATNPPLADSSFDMITALDIVEHVEDDRTMFNAFGRMLKPDGTLVVFTPAFNFLWGVQDEVSHHFRRYTARELREKITAAGLRIEKLTYVNTFLFPVVLAGRLVIRLRGQTEQDVSENEMHPKWSNGILKRIFAAERPLLRYINFPFGVSLLCVARKTDTSIE